MRIAEPVLSDNVLLPLLLVHYGLDRGKVFVADFVPQSLGLPPPRESQ